MPKQVRVRSSKYLNNGIEQDHRRVKQRIGPMLGFKRFDTAAITISGIELAAKIRKHHFRHEFLGFRYRAQMSSDMTFLQEMVRHPMISRSCVIRYLAAVTDYSNVIQGHI
jgi:hypothetical protein